MLSCRAWGIACLASGWSCHLGPTGPRLMSLIGESSRLGRLGLPQGFVVRSRRLVRRWWRRTRGVLEWVKGICLVGLRPWWLMLWICLNLRYGLAWECWLKVLLNVRQDFKGELFLVNLQEASIESLYSTSRLWCRDLISLWHGWRCFYALQIGLIDFRVWPFDRALRNG